MDGNISLFISCCIDKPDFDSQTKYKLTTEFKDFLPKPVLDDKFIGDLKKSSFIKELLKEV